MKKYKLIKEYPGSPKLDTICKYDKNPWSDSNAFTNPVLNPKDYSEFWQEVVEKDYEILEYKTENDISCKVPFLQKSHQFYINEKCKINSVNRKSDKKIFTIGDKTTLGIITCFRLLNNEIMVDFENRNSILLKSKQLQKVKQPLFTTEDGVDIFNYSKDHFYYVKKENFKLCENLKVVNPNINFIYEPKKELYFSTKEKAEEYIIMNKPLLSLNDILEFKPTNLFYTKIFKRAQKLNNKN